MGLDEKTYKPGMVQARISSAKNHLVSPTGYAANKEAYEGDMAAKVPAVREIYTRYWERCRQAGAMDFDDLLVYTYILFRDFPEVLARYREQFRYVLVDEYQDTNYAQHITSLTDIVLTLSFVQQTAKNKKIEEKRKKPLIYNSIISTGLCLTGGYAVNSATNLSLIHI